MSAYITGDTHGGFQRFGMKYFPEQKKMNREDTVIIAGDFGGLWGGTPAEEYWLDWLEDKPFTTAFLDGNHENFAMLNALPERLWHGGRIHEVRPHVLHLMRAYHGGRRNFPPMRNMKRPGRTWTPMTGRWTTF